MTVVNISFDDIKVGDRVQIVEKFVRSKSGAIRWAEPMKKYYGKIMKVDRVHLLWDIPLSLKLLDEDGYDEGWSWYPEMIAGVVVEEDLDSEESTESWLFVDLCSLL